MVLGVPGVSSAQTAVPDQPGTTVPDDGEPAPDRAPRGDGENCPDKEGGTEGRAPGGSSTSNAGFRRGPGGRV